MYVLLDGICLTCICEFDLFHRFPAAIFCIAFPSMTVFENVCLESFCMASDGTLESLGSLEPRRSILEDD